MSDSIELRGVSAHFTRGRGDVVRALRDVSLRVAASEYVTIIGPNGAGKSTLINVLAGSVPAQQGRVLIGTRDVTNQPDHRRAGLVGRVFQDPMQGTCNDLSVKENLSLAMLRGRRRSPLRLAVSHRRSRTFHDLLAQYERRLEHRLDQEAGRLSGGERQLLSVVMSVITRPNVLLLDEHTSALDPHIGQLVMERTDRVVRAEGLTTIMVTHNMRFAAEFGDRLLVMSHGRIADDISPSEKKHMTEDQLIQRFRESVVGELTDRLIGA